MRTIRINQSKTSKPLSKLIMKMQGTDYSHCSVELVSVPFDVTLIYEAKGFSSYVINKDHFDGEIVRSYEAIITDEQYHQILQFILQDAGTPYAWKSLLGFIVIKLASLVSIKLKNPWPQKGKICTESVGEILVRFFGVTPDVGYDDMDLIWVDSKLKSLSNVKEIIHGA